MTKRPALGWRFWTLWGGQSVSVLGDGAMLVGIPLLLTVATGNAVLASLSVALRTAAYVLLGAAAGPLIDRWDARRMMITCEVLRAVFFLALPGLATLRYGALMILVAAFAAAVAGMFFETALTVFVRDALDDGQLVRGNGRLEFSNQVGTLLGPAAIGALIAASNLTWCFVLNAATFVVSAMTIASLRGIRPAAAEAEAERARPNMGRELKEAFAFIRTHPVLARIVSLQTVVNLVVAAETLIVFYAAHTLRLSAAETGVVLAAAGAGGVLGTWFAGLMDRWFASTLLIGAAVAGLGISLLGMALARTVVELVLANALHGLLTVFASVHIRALRQRLAPRHMLGRVTALARSMAMASYPVGAVVFGLVADVSGNARASFAVAAALSLASSALAMRGLTAHRERTGADETAGKGVCLPDQ